MNYIFENYLYDASFSNFLEAANNLSKFQQDFTNLIISMKKGDYIGYFELGGLKLIGSSNFREDYVKKLKAAIKKEISPELKKYLIDTWVKYMKSKKESFPGYETLMLALDLEKNNEIFKYSDFNGKGTEDLFADRVIVSLMYGGDRLKAFNKYGNIPINRWAKTISANINFLRDTDTLTWMAQDVGGSKLEQDFYDGSVDTDTVLELFRKKYKI